MKYMTLMGLALGAIVFYFTACITDPKFEELKSIPVQEVVEENKDMDRSDLGLYFSQQRSFNWVKTDVPTNIGMILLDSKYAYVDYFFFLKFNKWFKQLKFENGIMPINQKENLDCDNFALLYKSLMGISSYKGKGTKEPAIAVMVVEQREAFGGIPAGYLHKINLVFTNQGWYVLEAQTGEFIKLEDYPNQKYIKYFII